MEEFGEKGKEKSEECASKFYNFEQNFAKQVNQWYGKVFENRKNSHFPIEKMVAFATKQNIDFRLVNNTRQYVH